MLAQIRKTVGEFFIFTDFHLHCTEPDSHHGGLIFQNQLEGGLVEVGDLIESSRY